MSPKRKGKLDEWRMQRLRVDERPVTKKPDTVVMHVRILVTTEQSYRRRAEELGMPVTTLMRRVLEAYREQVLAEHEVIVK